MKALSAGFALMLAMGAFSPTASAGVYTNDLARCLVSSSTPADKLTLVKWMFTAMSLHPGVKSMASVSPAQVDAENKAMADLFTKLMTRTCKTQAADAVKYEGGEAIKAGFKVLGQVAAKELFAEPHVAAGMAGLVKYMDMKKLQAVLDPHNK